MAAYTTHSIIGVETARLLGFAGVQRVAIEALRGRFRLDAQNSTDSFADVIGQDRSGMRVFIRNGPGTVLVLQHGILVARSNRPVATWCAAGSRPRELGAVVWDFGRRHGKQEWCQGARHYATPQTVCH
jgi:hypothetical protein